MPRLSDLPAALDDLRSQGLLRVPDGGGRRQELLHRFGQGFIDASSNDYLGLAAGLATGAVSRETSGAFPGISPAAVSRETPKVPSGAGASRLIHGTHSVHLEAEQTVAAWLGQPAALLFASGYSANLGALSALLDRNDLVVSDTLNHASLIDGIRLSRAETVVVPHLDVEAVRSALERPTAGARWVVVESYYSMDGDGPDLKALRELCDAAGASLYVDEAHAFGVFGPQGAGRLAAAGVRADVVMAAFGKAIGSQGAAIAASTAVRSWLWNRARSFVFSTAPSPHHTHRLLEQLARARAADGERAHLLELARHMREGLRAGGHPLPERTEGPIVSLIVGTPPRALRLAQALAEHGILVQAIRPPTVPAGQSRLRLTLHAALSRADVERLSREILHELAQLGEPEAEQLGPRPGEPPGSG